MKKLLFISCTFLFSVFLSAQNDFKKGYYINNEGVRTEGFIKTSNFKLVNDESVISLDFKGSLDQESIEINKSSISEFGADQEIKMQKITALLDDVSFFKDYTNEKSFSLQEKTVFLNVLVEGNATLYSYDGGKGIKYFWRRVDKEDIAKQLLYKKYYNSATKLTENTTFREQLFNNVKCPNQTFSDFLNVKYDKDVLISIFNNYNKCSNSNSITYKGKEEQKMKVRASVFFGYSFAKFQVINSIPERSAENFNMPTFGAEVEVFIPNEKASFFISTQYKKAQAESSYTLNLSEFNPNFTTNTYRLDTSILDFVIGARYYLNFNKLGSLFVGAGFGLNVPMANTINDYQTNNFSDLSLIDQTERLRSNPFARLHLGYIFNKHYGFDFNFDTGKNLVGNSPVKLKLNEMGINFRYTF